MVFFFDYQQNRCYNLVSKQENEMTMEITTPHAQTGWVTAIIEGHWVQAKVYDEPSTYGVNDGRVSKLVISKTAIWNPKTNFFDQMCFNYDRGLDFDAAPAGLVDKVIAALETLPKIFSPEDVVKNEIIPVTPVNVKKTKKTRFNI